MPRVLCLCGAGGVLEDERHCVKRVAAVSAIAIQKARLHEGLRGNCDLMAKHTVGCLRTES